jgi:hypothetical protein
MLNSCYCFYIRFKFGLRSRLVIFFFLICLIIWKLIFYTRLNEYSARFLVFYFIQYTLHQFNTIFYFVLLTLQTAFICGVHSIRTTAELKLTEFSVMIYFSCFIVDLWSFGQYWFSITDMYTVQFSFLYLLRVLG